MDKMKLLIIEDEEGIRNQMKWAMADDYDVSLAGDGIEALEKMRRNIFPLVLLDLGLPPSPRTADVGLKCLRDLLRIDAGAKVVVITGNQEKENALQAIEQGAFDYFLKPAVMEELRVVLKRAAHIYELQRESSRIKNGLLRKEFGEIIGDSPQIKEIFDLIRKVAVTDAPVLIEGESGTGKELVARAVHQTASGSNRMPFVAINCGAIPDTLLESELFGYEKGAFTGADSQRKGKIEHASGGTLFLDEISELPLLLQVKLLRFLQEYTIERIGGRETIPVRVRVISATNRQMELEVREGRFREDLFYRLGVVKIAMPPLRERGNDVVILANLFLNRSAAQYQRPVSGFSSEALAAIRSYSWPGNVRELENKVRRAVIICERKFLTPSDLNISMKEGESGRGETLKDIRSQVERGHIQKVLDKHNWNITRAAEELAVSRPTLHDMIKKYQIEKKP